MTAVGVGVVSLVVVLILFAEVHSAGKLADAHEVGALHYLGTQRRLVKERTERFHGTDIGIEAELLPHGKESLLGAHLSRGVVVVLQVAYSREEHSIGTLAQFIGFLRKRVAYTLYCGRTHNSVLEINTVAKLLAHCGHNINTLN